MSTMKYVYVKIEPGTYVRFLIDPNDWEQWVRIMCYASAPVKSVSYVTAVNH